MNSSSSILFEIERRMSQLPLCHMNERIWANDRDLTCFNPEKFGEPTSSEMVSIDIIIFHLVQMKRKAYDQLPSYMPNREFVAHDRGFNMLPTQRIW
ncbi:hypothetical protein AVEN_256537-1 [Araneus ventricosus]|uniref:Uncharacterized protein n=1 Tax=Araneus ventricosus TaxID=182803 RepID=A0A4Y2RRQ5_ARAVE|nr:hypothetical protein AVEN_256537-1 [Araneus ventricosus]